jgi:cellobiose PTS system EIIC component
MNKGNFIDRLMEVINTKLAPVMGAINENKTIQSIVSGFIGAVPATFIGAMFMLLLIISNYVPALAAITPAILTGYYLTLGFLGFYVALGIAISYARLYKLDQLTSALIGIIGFLAASVTVDLATTTISIENFGSNGVFPALVVTLLGMSFYRFTVEKKITIKMPPGVPPMIGNMFAAVIPSMIVVLVAWLVRSVLNFDLAVFSTQLLAPVFQAADNIFVVTLRMFLGMSLWSVGLHGDAMLMPIITPFQATWQVANAAAVIEGQPIPYIWTESFERLVLWVPSVWGLMFWMYFSKVKSHKALAVASTPAALFCIVEPIIFGLPIAFNVYLLIPFILSTTLATIFSYGGMLLGWFGKLYVGLPWFTPPPILAVLDSGGNWANLIMVIVNFAIGVLLYWPFYKAYEKKELEKEAEAEAELASEAA